MKHFFVFYFVKNIGAKLTLKSVKNLNK